MGPASRAAMQQPSESRIWIGSCRRDSAERSAKEARAAYFARVSTCVMIWILFLVLFLAGEFTSLSCQSDENPHRDDRAHHAEEHSGSGLRLCDAILQSK